MDNDIPFTEGECTCGAIAPFVGYPACPSCLGVSVVDAKTSESIVAEWVEEAESRFEDLTDGLLHPTDLLGALLLAESFERRTRANLVVLQDKPWAILRMLKRRPLTTDTTASYTGAFIKNATLAIDLAALYQLEYDIPSGFTALVRQDVSNGHKFPTFGFGPEIPLRLRQSYWMAATRIPFGQIPGALSKNDSIESWFTHNDPRGSYPALFKEHELSFAPVFANFQRQFYKVWAPGVIPSLSSMKPQRVRALVDLINFIETTGNLKTLEGDTLKDLPFLEVDAASLLREVAQSPDPTVLGDLLLGAGSVPVLPLIVNNSPAYGCPPLLTRHFRLIAGGYLTGLAGRQHIQEAGDQFELLVARLLKAQGLTTEIDEVELVNAFRAKNHNPDEIDVVALSGNHLLLLECKAEIDPPGAWTSSHVAKRTKALQCYAEKLEEKRKRWVTHIQDGKPIRIGKDWVHLPVADGQLKVDAGIISISLEPACESPVGISTLWPSKAAKFARDVFPVDSLCPIVGHEQLAEHLTDLFV